MLGKYSTKLHTALVVLEIGSFCMVEADWELISQPRLVSHP